MRKLLITSVLLIFCHPIFAQTINMDELILFMKSNFEEVNNKLLKKGWELNNSKIETDTSYAEIIWTFQATEDGRAPMWLSYKFTEYVPGYSYTDEQMAQASEEGLPPNILVKDGRIHDLHVLFVSINDNDYKQILEKIKLYKMQHIDSEVYNGGIVNSYEGANYVVSIAVVKNSGRTNLYEFHVYDKQYYKDKIANN